MYKWNINMFNYITWPADARMNTCCLTNVDNILNAYIWRLAILVLSA